MCLTVALFLDTAISNAAGGGSAITWVRSEGREQVTHDGHEGCLWSKPSGNCLTAGSLGGRDRGYTYVWGVGVCAWVHACVCAFIINFIDIENVIKYCK